MLPNRMVLNRQTEEQLKRLKGYTGSHLMSLPDWHFSARWRVSFAIHRNGIIGN